MPWRGKFTVVLCGVAGLAASAISIASAAPSSTRLISSEGRIVPIPASIPHEEGDMVDSRILPDLRWLAAHYPIYVTDGYSGPLPSGEHAGCNRCHTRNSDHYNGLAVDIVPARGRAAAATPSGGRSPVSPAGPSRARTAPLPRSAGSATTATPATAAATTSTSPGTTPPAREYRSPNGSKCFPVGSRPTMPRSPKHEPKPAPARTSIRGPPGGISRIETGGIEARRRPTSRVSSDAAAMRRCSMQPCAIASPPAARTRRLRIGL